MQEKHVKVLVNIAGYAAHAVKKKKKSKCTVCSYKLSSEKNLCDKMICAVSHYLRRYDWGGFKDSSEMRKKRYCMFQQF